MVSARSTLLIVVAGLPLTLLAQKPVEDECARTAGMQVYSSVFVHKETGDLLGYELAIERKGDSNVEALLYVYEGGESGPGIPLSGQIAKNHLSLQGIWVEHLLEGSSKRKIAEEHSVRIEGVLSSSTFRGELAIKGVDDLERIRLKHVPKIWSCNNSTAPAPN